jgi:hypothetical protein
MNDLSGTLNLLQGTQNAAGKNPVLNSAFQVWQRGTSIAGGNENTYVSDRWVGCRAGAAAGMTVSRQTTGDTTNLPNIQYCARIQRNAANTGTGVMYVTQSFESINSIPLAGKSVVISYYARVGANYSGTNFAINLYSGTGTDQNYLAAYTGSATVATSTPTLTTTWTRFTATGTVASTATELAIVSTWTPVGTAGAADYVEITGVQLEASTTAASAFSTNGGTYQAELAACQRYLPAFTGPNSAVMGFAYGTNTSLYNIPFAVTARVAPTGLTVSGTTNAYALNTATSVTPAFSVSSINNCQVTASHTITAGQGAQLVVGGLLLFTGCEL